jgi:single-strand DNA-binding protein
MNLNKIMLIGRATKDPEIKTTPGGTTVAKFGMATNDVYKDKAGQKVEETEYHNCVAFGKLAEVIGSFVKKGQEIYVEGKKKTRSWEKDGKTNYIVEVIVDVMQLGSRPGEAKSAKVESAVGSDEIDVKDIPF